MAENLNTNQNQNPQPVQSGPQNPPNVPVNQPPSPPPAKPPGQDSQDLFKLFGSRLVFIIAAVAAILLLVLVVLYAGRKKPAKPTMLQETPSLFPLASIDPNASPVELPKVQEEDKKAPLREFFKRASPENFKEAFLDTLPAEAADSYIKYSSAGSEKDKQAAAKGFYILLNNPAAPRDAQFKAFVKDVRATLEKEIGKPLFAP